MKSFELTDIHVTFYPTAMEYVLFLRAPEDMLLLLTRAPYQTQQSWEVSTHPLLMPPPLGAHSGLRSSWEVQTLPSCNNAPH